MELFRQELRSTLTKIRGHATVKNVSIDITEAGLTAMKAYPEYRDKVLQLISRDIGSSCAPRDASVLIHVGSNLDCCRADSWPAINDSEYRIQSQHSFYRRTSDDKADEEPLWKQSRICLQRHQTAERMIRQDMTLKTIQSSAAATEAMETVYERLIQPADENNRAASFAGEA